MPRKTIWGPEEDEKIVEAVKNHTLNLVIAFEQAAEEIKGKTVSQIAGRYYSYIRKNAGIFFVEEEFTNVKNEKRTKHTKAKDGSDRCFEHTGEVWLISPNGNGFKRLPHATYRVLKTLKNDRKNHDSALKFPKQSNRA